MLIRNGLIVALSFPLIAFLYIQNWYTLLAALYIIFSLSPLLFLFGSDGFCSVTNISRGKLTLVLYILGAVNFLIVSSQVGMSLNDIINLDNLREFSKLVNTGRYSGIETQKTNGSPLIFAGMLSTIFFIGNRTGNTISIILTTLAPSLFTTIMTSEKFPFLLAFLFYVAGTVMSGDKLLKSINPFVIVPVFGLWFGVAVYNRGYDDDFINIFLNYTIPQYNNFGFWLSEMYDGTLSFGSRTFSGPLSLLGIATRIDGVFDKSLTFNSYESNIYSGWRYLVEDFGYFGPFFLNLIIFFCCLLFKFFKMNRQVGVFSIFIFMSLSLSFTTTLFVYNSVALAFCVIAFIKLYENIIIGIRDR